MLVSLNLSQNKIFKIEGLKTLRELKNLDVSDNKIFKMNSISELWYLPSLTNVDLSNNQIEYNFKV